MDPVWFCDHLTGDDGAGCIAFDLLYFVMQLIGYVLLLQFFLDIFITSM